MGYEALGEQERLLFDRLAVFAGSWDLDAAEAVCTDGHLIEFAGVADLLDELVSKSLVVTERTSSGTTRYRFLEPLRQFAEDRLGQRDQGLTTRSRHLEHYTRWAESWNADVWGAPMAGYFSYGEIGGPTSGSCDFHNETCMLLAVRETSHGRD